MPSFVSGDRQARCWNINDPCCAIPDAALYKPRDSGLTVLSVAPEDCVSLPAEIQQRKHGTIERIEDKAFNNRYREGKEGVVYTSVQGRRWRPI